MTHLQHTAPVQEMENLAVLQPRWDAGLWPQTLVGPLLCFYLLPLILCELF